MYSDFSIEMYTQYKMFMLDAIFFGVCMRGVCIRLNTCRHSIIRCVVDTKVRSVHGHGTIGQAMMTATASGVAACIVSKFEYGVDFYGLPGTECVS